MSRSRGWLRRMAAPAALAVVLAGLAALASDAPAGADTATFSSASLGSTIGTTASFNQSGAWQMHWSYDCSSLGTAGYFQVDVVPANTNSANSTDFGPSEQASSDSGTSYYYDSGTFSLFVFSQCPWTISVQPAAAPDPLPLPTSFSSTLTGSSGTTQEFTTTSAWTMTWSYDCSNLGPGSTGNFSALVATAGALDQFQTGPDEQGSSGTGTDYYYGTGTFSLVVVGDCTWTASVQPSTAGPLTLPASFSSAQSGSSGALQQFTAPSAWTLSWSYDCSNAGAAGTFVIGLLGPSNPGPPDALPAEFGVSGSSSGTDYFYGAGTFSFTVFSDCTWTIAVRPATAVALSLPASFSATQTGSSGLTQRFAVSSPWSLSWSYDCTSLGSYGYFAVSVVQPTGDAASDSGPSEDGFSGSGTDYYTDTGTFSLDVSSLCNWTITVQPSPGPLSLPARFSSSQTGTSGHTQEFTTSSPWTMSWSYDCGNQVVPGTFSVRIVGPNGVPTTDVGPNQSDFNGSGTSTYPGGSTFSLDVGADCPWTIDVAKVVAPVPVTSPSPATTAEAVGIASTPDGGGYWIAYADGAVHAHGDAGSYGGVQGLRLNAPITHIVSTPDGKGYWLVAGDGGTFTEGDAPFYGSTGGTRLNASIVDIAPTPDGQGYWLVAADGGIFSYGDAQFFGSAGGLHLNQPVVGMAATHDGGGYWLVARDGGIFAYGDATFLGSTGAIRLNKPVNGMAASVDGGGYWFVASDGGIFAYGDAPFMGSTGSLSLNAPIVGMAQDTTTGGYWLLGSDGGVFSEGAPFHGAG